MPIILGQISQKRKGTPAGEDPKPATQAYPRTFPMRTKRRFCRKGMARRRLRSARELLAQIVLFGVELGVEFGVGIVGTLDGSFARGEAGIMARRRARIAE